MRWILGAAALAAGCQTAAVFDVEAPVLGGAVVTGAQRTCDGGGVRLFVALYDQHRRGFRLSDAREASLPDGAVRLLALRADGADVETDTVDVAWRATPEGLPAAVLDRSAAACGAAPVARWDGHCNARPCAGPGSGRCTAASGCCDEGAVCVADTSGAPACVDPSDDCGGRCGRDQVCDDGSCLPRLWGAADPGDRLVGLYAETLGALVGRDEGREPAQAWSYVALRGGVYPLAPEPVADFAPARRALEQALIAPFGAPGLLGALQKVPDDAGARLVWALRPGPDATIDADEPLVFAVLATSALTAADDAAFGEAACASGGAYLRLPDDDAVTDVARTGVPAMAAGWLTVDVPGEGLPDGLLRLTGRLVVDTARLTGSPGSSRPSIEVPFEVTAGGGR